MLLAARAGGGDPFAPLRSRRAWGSGGSGGGGGVGLVFGLCSIPRHRPSPQLHSRILYHIGSLREVTMLMSRMLGVLLVSCLIGCDDSSTAPITPQPHIELGPGMTHLLAHQEEGTRVPITVLVTVNGKPAEGVEVLWGDGRTPTNLSTRRSVSNADGIAETTWNLPYNSPTVPWATYHAQAAVPGASGNPVHFSIEVVRCTKC